MQWKTRRYLRVHNHDVSYIRGAPSELLPIYLSVESRNNARNFFQNPLELRWYSVWSAAFFVAIFPSPRRVQGQVKVAPPASLSLNVKHKDTSRRLYNVLNKPCTGSPSAIKAFCEQAPPPSLCKHQTGLRIHDYLDRAQASVPCPVPNPAIYLTEDVTHKGASTGPELLEKAELFVFPADDQIGQRDEVDKETATYTARLQYCATTRNIRAYSRIRMFSPCTR